MNIKAPVISVVLALFLLLNLVFSSGVCTSANTPNIKAVDIFEIGEGEFFKHDFNLTNMDEEDVYYTFALIDEELTGIKINNNGILTFVPSSDDVGESQIAVLTVKGSCADTIVVALKIFDKPNIVSFNPKNSSFQMNQTAFVVFSITAKDKDVNDTLMYEWLVDDELINDSANKTSYRFMPGFDLSGVHEISARVTDSHNLSTTKTWAIQISKINRPPVLMYEIPNIMVFKNTAASAYNLNDHFVDPDGGKLMYEYRQVSPSFEVRGASYANISVIIASDGFITYDPALNTSGYAYIVFIAYDILNLSAESNIVKIDIVSSDQFEELEEAPVSDFCGDEICGVNEKCETCPYDCGECEQNESLGCMPKWDCTEWDECKPAGFTKRICTDINICNDKRTKPDEIKKCIYTADCDDGIKNGVEEGVDCGGICEPCPTCDDGIQNHGEEGIDCGGPCNIICSNCQDEILNQNESDVDCGGPCDSCVGGKKCLKNLDCESLRCDHLVCTTPTCDDGIRNQGEKGIDCDGPCEKFCGNCSDGIQNRGEDGVDCGGRCRPCPSCFDNIKNGEESLVDCGGECRPCLFNDYFKKYLLIFIIVFVIIGLIPFLFVSYLFFLASNPNKARNMYESNTGFAFLVSMNKFFRKIRKKKHVLGDDVIQSFINELTEMGKRPNIDDSELHLRIKRIYKAIFSLPEEYDSTMFKVKLKYSHIPFYMKILFAGFYKKSEILPLATFVPQEQKSDMIVELKFLLNELRKG